MRVLFATDLGPGSQVALSRAASVATASGGELVVLHVVECRHRTELPEGLERARRSELVTLVPDDPRVRCEHLLETGDPVATIRRIALIENASTIVLAVRRRRHWFGDRVADRLLREAPCPVLCVPCTPPVVPPVADAGHEAPIIRDSRRIEAKRIAARLRTTLEAETVALQSWLESRTAAVTTLARRPLVQEAAAELVALAASGDFEALRRSRPLETLREFLLPVARAGGWLDFSLCAGGRRIASFFDARIDTAVAEGAQKVVSEALAGEAGVSLPFRERVRDEHVEGRLWHEAAAPVTRAGEPFAALTLRLRAETELLRQLAAATTGRSGETYAFDATGLMVSGSRFEAQLRSVGLLPPDPHEGAALNVRLFDPGGNLLQGHKLPTDRPMPLTSMARRAIAGTSGIDLEGYRDYRGVDVVGAWAWFESYGFGIATEVDAADVR